MSYTSNDMQITLIHPVVSAGQGSIKVMERPVYEKRKGKVVHLQC